MQTSLKKARMAGSMMETHIMVQWMHKPPSRGIALLCSRSLDGGLWTLCTRLLLQQKNSLQLPMRKYFKSRFPMLPVKYRTEIYATDTLFLNTTALSEIKLAICLALSLEFVRKYGAMDGLFRNNAKIQISCSRHLYSVRHIWSTVQTAHAASLSCRATHSRNKGY